MTSYVNGFEIIAHELNGVSGIFLTDLGWHLARDTRSDREKGKKEGEKEKKKEGGKESKKNGRKKKEERCREGK